MTVLILQMSWPQREKHVQEVAHGGAQTGTHI